MDAQINENTARENPLPPVMAKKTSYMETHAKVIGWLYIVLGGLGLLATLFMVVAIAGGGLISQDRTAIVVTGVTAALIGLLLVVVSLPGIIAGIGLLRLRPWARIMALVLGILNLPGFPVGTLLGIYTIWVLLDEEGRRLFEG